MFRFARFATLTLLTISACAGSSGTGTSEGTGGEAGPGTGGGGGSETSGRGGATGSGGLSSSGGTTGAGGAGPGATGGALGSGGAATGGAPGTGGLSATGGRSGSGGRGGSAGGGGASGDSGARDAGVADGAADAGPQAPGGTIGSYGAVYFVSSTRTQIVRLQTTLTVPAKPPASGTLFLWPGLEPLQGSAHFSPIGTGVLQPVLTWGNSCAPGAQPRAYSTWWISAQYVNTLGNAAGFMGCFGGPVLAVNVGDALNIDMQLVGTGWNQTVTDVQTGKSVTFTEDLGGQAQNWALFVIEAYSSAPVSPVTFTDTVITYGAADATDCKLDTRGPTDFVSVPVASADGLTCSVAQIVLRAKGIP
jgi:hypothetical protein